MDLRTTNGQLKPGGAFRLIATGYLVGAGAIFIPAFALAAIGTLLVRGGRHFAVSLASLAMAPIIIALQSVMFGGLVVFGLWLYCRRRSIRIVAQDDTSS